MIKSLNEMPRAKKIEVDLSGPHGNAYYLLGLAIGLAEELDLEKDIIRKEMMASDYDNLLKVFDNYFGEIVNLYH